LNRKDLEDLKEKPCELLALRQGYFASSEEVCYSTFEVFEVFAAQFLDPAKQFLSFEPGGRNN
jgi:hypothetical protein